MKQAKKFKLGYVATLYLKVTIWIL